MGPRDQQPVRQIEAAVTKPALQLAILGLAVPAALSAQGGLQLEARALLLGTVMRPTPLRTTLREFRLVQPVVMVSIEPLAGLVGRLTFNAEAWTLAKGELTAGAWGEGFVDRRHPHTAWHELLISGSTAIPCGRVGCRVGLFAGKGFVPFGSDDPMSRPIAAYPVNHHLAQILERAVVAGQASIGPVAIEASLFNGDEPERPWQWPKISRFADSWSGRVTVNPFRGLELSASVARVASPEARVGTGPTQQKIHFAVRPQGTLGRTTLGGLAEWARTTEVDGVFRFHSLLAEGWAARGDHRVAIRFERTERPEEERVTEFREVRPRIDNSLLGVTRWTLLTANYGYRGAAGRFSVEPFVEGTIGSIAEIAGGIFEVASTYGGTTVKRVTLGMKLAWRDSGHRMGRYGILGHPGSQQHQHQKDDR